MSIGRAAAGALAAVVALLVAAPALAPYAADDAARELAYAPPTPIRLADDAGRCCAAPWVAAWVATDTADGTFAYRVAPEAGRGALQWRPELADAMGQPRRPLVGVQPPHRLLVLGADGYGRDVLSRLLLGGRVSLLTGLAATALVLSIATAMGLLMALGPRMARRTATALADVMQVLPWIYLLLAFRALLPLALPPAWAMAAIVCVLVAAGWASSARVVAGEARTLAAAAFLDAARAAGASPWRILWHHVLRHTWPVLAAQATVVLPRFVLAEVTLSFLGLGLGEPTPSLGALLMPLREPGIVQHYWWLAAPALALVALFALMHASAGAFVRAWQRP